MVRTLTIIRSSENSYLMRFYKINICQVMIFSLYIVYKKYNDDKNWRSNHRRIASIITSPRIILLPAVNLQCTLRKNVYRLHLERIIKHFLTTNIDFQRIRIR